MRNRILSHLAFVCRLVTPVAAIALCPVPPASAEFGDELYKLIASDDGSLGSNVAISGNTAIASGLATGNGEGSAYLFDTATGQQLWKLSASDAAPFDQFGSSVAINGTRAVVGAHLKGAAYVFDVTTGQELWKLTASDNSAGTSFGNSVAISGSLAIVGAHLKTSETGAVYVFDVMTGQELWKLTASDAVTGARFGNSVAISGNTAIKAAPGTSSAYLFDLTTGSELLKLPVGGPVAISGNTAIVADGSSRSAYLFDVKTGQELHKLTASDADSGDVFSSVAINGNTAILGARGDDNFGNNSGATYVFDVTTGQQLAKLTSSDAGEGQFFGSGVGVSGDLAIMASPALLADTLGSAYVFEVTRDQNIPGDFNTDGTVDAADYIVWRNGLGTTYTQSDHDEWRANFGRSSSINASTPGYFSSSYANIPEPATVLLMALLIPLLAAPREKFRQPTSSSCGKNS